MFDNVISIVVPLTASVIAVGALMTLNAMYWGGLL